MHPPSGRLPALNPGFELLCLGVGRALGRGSPHLAAILAADHDWDGVLRSALRHRCLGLLAHGLEGLPLPDAPADALRRLARRQAQRALACAAETARLAARLENAGLRPLTLKGQALSLQLHGQLALRDPGDIDLLVAPAEFWAAVALLGEAGYAPLQPLPSEGLRQAAGHRLRDIGFRHEGSGMLVELHQRLTANHHRLPVEFDAIWEERTIIALAGHRVATLPEALLRLYLCVHGAHHRWDRLSWIADMTALLNTPAAAASAIEAATPLGLDREMRLATLLGARLFGEVEADAGLPVGQADRDRANRFIARHFGAASAEGRLPRLRDAVARHIHRYSFKPGLRARLHELSADLTNPTDLNRFPLPPAFLWLYPAFRPFALLARKVAAWREAKRVGPRS
ncbi:nucleotidyltransferase family protein [Roseomonas stagni]|uniref:Nucleotidyltransferase family protein n=1 Tax=Falsiroseomonas algicola TaxID=2716930 RepID=A0A6M1LUR7_9PROT|nr:nucleotidyltransferase family protein [Falsiroseomonas algicola]NGM24191.1 nucleotidyltransferase family protein [Falsiroseomonas algicola]